MFKEIHFDIKPNIPIRSDSKNTHNIITGKPIKHKRNTFLDIFIGMVLDVALRSEAPNTKIGCLILSLRKRQVLSYGYNAYVMGINRVPQLKVHKQ
jgi:deoxycytidylate deaminase